MTEPEHHEIWKMVEDGYEGILNELHQFRFDIPIEWVSRDVPITDGVSLNIEDIADPVKFASIILSITSILHHQQVLIFSFDLALEHRPDPVSDDPLRRKRVLNIGLGCIGSWNKITVTSYLGMNRSRMSLDDPGELGDE